MPIDHGERGPFVMTDDLTPVPVTAAAATTDLMLHIHASYFSLVV